MSNVKKSPALERIEQVLDEHSFVEIGALVQSRNTDFDLMDQQETSDGVITGHGLVDGKLVFIYSQDATVVNGTIGEMHGKKIASIYDMAMKMGAPIIGLIDCGGVRLQESVDALEAIGVLYQKSVEASGVVPQVMGVFGNCGGGLSVLAGLSDFVYMEEKANMYFHSPDALPGNRKDVLDTASAEFQGNESGIVDSIGSTSEILADIRKCVNFLPGSNREDGAVAECFDDLNRGCEGLEQKRGDIISFVQEIADDKLFLETKKGFAQDMITGFVKLNGVTIGVVANQKKEEGLTVLGCEKAAQFVQFCDAFEIPVLSMVNVSGYEASVAGEKGLAKAVAKLTFAFGNATVPKISLLLEKAYGSAYIVMNSKSLGADLVFAYPDTEVGTMEANLAAKIMYPTLAGEELNKKALEYHNMQSGAEVAAKRGYVDRILSFVDTRKYLIAGFEMLYSKRMDTPYKKHGTK